MRNQFLIETLEPREFFSFSSSAASPEYAPQSIAGLTFNCKVLQGSSPFASLGTFTLHFNSNKLTYSISGPGIITSGARYSYTRTTLDHAVGLLNKGEDTEQTMSFRFTSAHSGVLITNPDGVDDPRKVKFSF
jgi:hypothetical protein